MTGFEPPETPFGDSQWDLQGLPVPAIVRELAGGAEPRLAWHNELHGLTFRIDERYLKWSPFSAGIDLDRERVRLEWLAGRHPAPIVLDHGSDDDGQWLLTAALPGDSAVVEHWRSRPEIAIPAIATGLRALHALPVDEFPDALRGDSWVDREPPGIGPRPPVDGPVVVHGDACAPNTLLTADGAWAGNVDFGDLTVGDRWADLAVATMSLDWNYTSALESLFWRTYGVEPDAERIRWYRALWDLES